MESKTQSFARCIGALAFAAADAAFAAGGPGGGTLNQTTASVSMPTVQLSTTVGTSSSVAINVSDVGSAPLAIGTVALAGPQAADYTIGGTCVPGAVVNRGGTPCSIQLAFNPTVVGTSVATISLTFANAPAAAINLSSSGLAPAPTAPSICVTVSPLNGSSPACSAQAPGFGSRPLGNPAPAAGTLGGPLADEVVFVTTGGGPVVIASATIIGANPADWQFAGSGTPVRTTGLCAFALLPNINPPCGLPLSFFPTALGPRSATLRITSNDPAHPLIDIPLTGTGTPGVPTVAIPQSLTDFTALWGMPNDNSWSLAIVHHKFASTTFSATDGLVAFWHTYDVNGLDLWLELKNGSWTTPTTYVGTLYRPTGSPFSAVSNPAQLNDVAVGPGSLTFTDANNGTLAFSVNGVAGSKTITRGVGAF